MSSYYDLTHTIMAGDSASPRSVTGPSSLYNRALCHKSAREYSGKTCGACRCSRPTYCGCSAFCPGGRRSRAPVFGPCCGSAPACHKGQLFRSQQLKFPTSHSGQLFRSQECAQSEGAFEEEEDVEAEAAEYSSDEKPYDDDDDDDDDDGDCDGDGDEHHQHHRFFDHECLQSAFSGFVGPASPSGSGIPGVLAAIRGAGLSSCLVVPLTAGGGVEAPIVSSSSSSSSSSPSPSYHAAASARHGDRISSGDCLSKSARFWPFSSWTSGDDGDDEEDEQQEGKKKGKKKKKGWKRKKIGDKHKKKRSKKKKKKSKIFGSTVPELARLNAVRRPFSGLQYASQMIGLQI